MIKKIEFQSGQAIILVVLLLMVALTVGLAVTTRTTTDLSMSRQLEQSQRAFSAAEAGIEIALLSSALENSGSAGSATFRYVVKDTGTEEFIFPAINASCAGNVCEDDSFQLWLKNETESYGSNKIKIAWGVSSSSEKPAIEIAALYKEGIDYKIKRWVFNPSDKAGRENGFSSIDNSSFTIAGTGFKYSTDLDLPSGVGIENLLIRGKLFYTKNNQVGFKSLDGGTFPKQGKLIESTGTDQGTTRKIEVFSGHPILPGLFDYAIFSKDGLIGNE